VDLGFGMNRDSIALVGNFVAPVFVSALSGEPAVGDPHGWEANA
jgi:hypothetical protein